MADADRNETSPSDDVLILTLAFDEAGFSHFDAMRRAHFPARRNKIPAHLTLFHKLPGERSSDIRSDLAAVASKTGTFTVSVTALRFLGYGSAYVVASKPLTALRAELATRWFDELSAQDAQRFTPHVTIQNKVGAGEARSLFQKLEGEFEPFEVKAEGMLLWRYLGGPWDLVERYDFAKP